MARQAGTFYWSVGRGGGGRRSSEAVTTEGESAAVPAVVDVELSVPPGHLVCVYGPTGCGKSALLLAMLGELRGAPQVGRQGHGPTASLTRSEGREGVVGIVVGSRRLLRVMRVADEQYSRGLTTNLTVAV